MAKAGPRAGARRTTDPATGADDVKARLVDAAIAVLARDGFAHASARAIATEAGGVNGLIFYHFGSMDGLLAATMRTLVERGIARIRDGLGGDQATTEWPQRLGHVIRSEADGDEGRAVMELFVGSRTSPALAAEVRAAVDEAMRFATDELGRVFDRTLGDSPMRQLLPVDVIAELAAAAFLGLEVLTQNGREIDLDRLAAQVSLTLAALGALASPR